MVCWCVLHSRIGWLLLQCCLLIRRQRRVDCCANLVIEALLLTYCLPRLVRLLLLLRRLVLLNLLLVLSWLLVRE